MAGFRGTADAVSAFFGGDRIEEQAFNKEASRIMAAKNAQAMLNKRVLDAFVQSRQIKAQDEFPGLIDSFISGRKPGEAPDQTQIGNLVSGAAAAQGYSGNYSGNVDQMLQTLMRPELMSSRQAEGMTDPNAIVNAFFKPEQVPNVQKVGDLIVGNLYGDQPVVDEALTAANAKASASTDPSGNLALREREIARIMRQIDPETGQPFSPEKAGNIADGLLRFEISEATGKVVKTDVLNNSVTEIPITGGSSGMLPSPQPEDQTLYSLADNATGLANTAKDYWARGKTLLGGDADLEATQAIQTINTSLQSMIRALAINPRFPAYEQKRILEEIKIQPGWLTSPAVMRSRMESIAKSLTVRMENALRDANDPSAPEEVREGQRSNAIMIQNFLPQLGVPGYEGIVESPIATEFKSLPGWDDLTRVEQEEYITRTLRERGQ